MLLGRRWQLGIRASFLGAGRLERFAGNFLAFPGKFHEFAGSFGEFPGNFVEFTPQKNKRSLSSCFLQSTITPAGCMNLLNVFA
ncbi:hypothetical protein GA0061096_4306 [Fictibacillus enclensis]|nr:hypothetical protein GA0061096_4306 [Fictibacillus enclensis]